MIDRLILTSNDDPHYLNLIPMVRDAWRQLGFCVYFAFVGEDRSVECDLRVNPIEGLPTGHHAKIMRMILGSALPGVSMLGDADMLPLSKKFFDEYSRFVGPNTITSLGHDLYDGIACGHSYDGGKSSVMPENYDRREFRWPMCYLTASRDVWERYVNPRGLEWRALISSWRDRPGRANPWREPFSDESLFIRLVEGKGSVMPEKLRLTSIIRTWREVRCEGEKDVDTVRIAVGRVDRSTWEYSMKMWHPWMWIDAHLPRPILPEHGIDILLSHVGLDPKKYSVV